MQRKKNEKRILMKTKLGMKCYNCGFWNSIEVEKVFSGRDEPKELIRKAKAHREEVM